MTRFIPIVNFPGYRVGDNGEVQTAWQRKSNGGRMGTRAEIGKAWKKLVPRTHSNGYPLVSLRHKSRGYRLCYVHHLVLEAFVGPRPKGLIGCHKDDDPTNNAVTNLRWGTRAVNAADWRGSLLTVEIDGRILSVLEWSQISGIDRTTIRTRLKAGWDARQAVFKAAQPRRKRA